MQLVPSSPRSAFRAQAVALGLLLLGVLATASTAQEPTDPADDHTDLRYWSADHRDDFAAYEAALVDVVDPKRLGEWHASYTAEPHVAGSRGDLRVIESLADDLRVFGLETTVHSFRAYLPRPVGASLQIVAGPDPASIPGGSVFGTGQRELPIDLPLREKGFEGADDLAAADGTDLGWNAYAATGDVTAGVVYANRATKEDFERLEELGVDVRGQIVLARYGGNFRGYKAKFASAAGAAGLVIFTDPGDAGYTRGAVWPEGGWANETYIQRGSILTLPYPGDPLTPFVEASADAERLDPADLALPTIPVQPIGWGAAWEILRRMTGRPVPTDWQGGLPTTYRLGVGDDVELGPLRLRLQVEQERRLVDTANVVGVLVGSERPDEWVLVGSHHDAWSYGAGDPNAGTMLVTEAARAFAAAAQRGHRPKRSVVFAHWGAEEFGIVGSTEWAEAERRRLTDGAVAYLNLDGAAMGPRFSASASPSLKSLLTDIVRAVETPDGGTVYDQWMGDRSAEQGPRFGDLGGGSDHVAFYCHLGIPSAGVSGGGSPGTSYHSNYEHLAWYRATVGDDYAPAAMLTEIVVRFLARLADADLLPLDPAQYGPDFARHLDAILERAGSMDDVDGSTLSSADLKATAERYGERANGVHQRLVDAAASGALAGDALQRANRILLGLERLWLHEPGIPDRPWYRNLFAATDEDSGYAPWMLPGLRWVVEREQPDRWQEMEVRYLAVFQLLDQQLTALEALLPEA